MIPDRSTVPLRFLHLEDAAADAELTLQQLRTEWPDCIVSVVDGRETFTAELRSGGYDLILSDFNLSPFNGLEALELARQLRPEMPFVFFSGTIGEDQAVAAMRGGAVDYVLKDRPKRLIPALRRALDTARERLEHRATEEQILRMQRLENIGMLAAGIAHDFNNVLAPVFMAVPLLREQARHPASGPILDAIERSVERGAGLVRQIIGFVQGVTGEPHLVQPRHLLRELLAILRQTFPRSIRIEDEIPAGLWPLTVNPTQLHQVLLNLCVNARDAMPGGGVLHLRAHNHVLSESSEFLLPAGSYLWVEVADTGTGIPSDVLPRIWEPFFTTKPAGQGTGLGLPTVRSIVESQGGTVTLATAVGQGTSFRLLLPASPGRDPVGDLAEPPAVPAGTAELILVVDDDPGVRDLTTVMLARHGYRVLAASNAAEALALFAPRSLEVRLVLTDLGLPEIDGLTLAQIVVRLNPTTRILMMTGFGDASARLRDARHTGPLLPKPFTAESLLRALHEALLPVLSPCH